MTTKADVASMLDEAREGNYERLQIFVELLVRERHTDKLEIVTETLFIIAKKLAKGEPSVLLAPQIVGIVKNVRLEIYKRENKQTAALTLGGDEQLERYSSIESTDPAEIIAAAEVVRETIAMLARMKESDPRQFAILEARFSGISDDEYMKLRGEVLKPGALRQLRTRTKKTLEKKMQEVRKASEP
jgi:hypothetical protein